MVERSSLEASAESPLSKRLRMTLDEFMAWASEDTHAEWVNGEVIVFMPATDRHQDLFRFIFGLIDLFVNLFKLGKVRSDPFSMHLSAQASLRQPDILFVANQHLDRLTPNRLEGPADLVIESIADDSVTRDRVDKFDAYEAAGIPEYWIIDPRPNRQRAHFYHLDERGQYQPILPDKDGLYRSAVLSGFWLNVNWLWQAELPAPLWALGEIAGREKVVEALGKIRNVERNGQGRGGI
jgi:Uma2 family endonuclease